jgi:hypothetical protein
VSIGAPPKEIVKEMMNRGKLTSCGGILCMFAGLVCAPQMKGQAAVDVSVGLGANHSSATGVGIDNAFSSNAFGSCSLNVGDAFCQATPGLNGVFMGIGGDIMFKDHFGAGFQFNFQPTKHDYGPLQYRESFIDVNGIFAPINRKRWSVQILGGIGSARTGFSFSQSSCVGTAVCSTQSQSVGTANHFAIHGGVALQYFVWNHVFIKPQFDYHYVPNLNDQFGSNSVPGAMISIGYGSSR